MSYRNGIDQDFWSESLLQAGFGLGCGLGTLGTLKWSGGEGAQASGFGSLATFSALVLTSIYVDRSLGATLFR